uniref:B-cell receptor CD22-like n=1 Tax=Poecilia reticulata TaxID=8081 RepID=A0A3P9QAU7_POERE
MGKIYRFGFEKKRINGYSQSVALFPPTPGEVTYSSWSVTYSQKSICALKGSTVKISCKYSHPSWEDHLKIRVTQTFWFAKIDKAPVDVTTQEEYAGRVEYKNKNSCALTIRDVEESDSAVYKFRFITNTQHGSYTGEPGVQLFVTDPNLTVKRKSSSWNSDLICSSSCVLPDDSTYVWYKNGHNFHTGISVSYYKISNIDSMTCALKGHEDFPSPSVYSPKRADVSLSHAEIVEGDSVNLTCSSDGNPAPFYRWYKDNQMMLQGQGGVYQFTSVKSEDSGTYCCEVGNICGRINSSTVLINVEYSPRLPSVSVSPAGDVAAGSSVNLTCSSDANPAATYTWYTEHSTSPAANGQTFTIVDIRGEHGGNYYYPICLFCRFRCALIQFCSNREYLSKYFFLFNQYFLV